MAVTGIVIHHRQIHWRAGGVKTVNQRMDQLDRRPRAAKAANHHHRTAFDPCHRSGQIRNLLIHHDPPHLPPSIAKRPPLRQSICALYVICSLYAQDHHARHDGQPRQRTNRDRGLQRRSPPPLDHRGRSPHRP
ncbi:hypothetical protein KVU_PB0208 (plasmid) [Ketogulonicigenium vulgare WSH-001]|uniref:Uncharacterized protein n=1 Tax=Ketogulonicigenium vulgare (strain WSH-001) TaxID=759362 RepID=F9YBY4_KETVW|nr:hypothetical protein KVU_PB0208 [Ketogulonicigenium vulgare WSH-001]